MGNGWGRRLTLISGVHTHVRQLSGWLQGWKAVCAHGFSRWLFGKPGAHVGVCGSGGPFTRWANWLTGLAEPASSEFKGETLSQWIRWRLIKKRPLTNFWPLCTHHVCVCMKTYMHICTCTSHTHVPKGDLEKENSNYTEPSHWV